MKRSMRVIFVCILVLGFFVAGLGSPSVRAAGELPSYQLLYLGPGSPAAINNLGTVVGAISSGSYYSPLVSTGGAPWSALPTLPGAMSVFPTDINDNGVIVGVSYNAQWNPVAVRWLPQGGGYVIQELPRLPGDSSSYATGINNLGQIVGARSALGYVPNGYPGWLYSDALGPVNLLAAFNWDPIPSEINDNGQIIGGTSRLNINTGAIEPIGNSGPTNYYAITGVDINNAGQVAGQAPMTSQSLNIVSVFRYSDPSGWFFVAGTSKYTVASSINNLGDVGYGELGAGVYLDELGTYAVNSLLDPSVVAAGWAITGSGVKINDQRQVATLGTNSQTGQSGAVLLTSTGSLQPPTAPSNLQGFPHTATAQQPWNSIDLTWVNTSSATTGYELQRSVTNENNWVTLALTPPGTATSHTDTTVGLGITYDYRVRAIGVAGASPWSNLATVTSPSTPLDTSPPTVTIVTPSNGAVVSGVVTITAQAVDNVGVEYLEISYWNQYLGQEIILGSISGSGSLTVSWDTTSLTPASYAIWAYAYDALGNWTQEEISVNVSGSVKTLKVSNITLTGTIRKGTATITGTVYIVDGSGVKVSGANVGIRWTLPDGSTRTTSALTNSKGTAKFTTSGPSGTYTLTVTSVAKTGYVFDPAGSILTKSITR